MSEQRILQWDGYPNARDFGSLPTKLSSSGETVLGRIARGPRRERMTASGWDEADAWGLRSIVDLRCHYEVGKQDGDPVTASERLAKYRIIGSPVEDHADEEFRRLCFPILDSPEYWVHHWRLQPELLRNAFSAIAGADPGVLVHCSAGRDRTGMISALLLGHAGVPPESVADDYAAAVRAMAGVNSHSPTADSQSEWKPQRIDAWLVDKLPIVRQAARNASEILTSLKVPAAVQEALRAKLLDQ